MGICFSKKETSCGGATPAAAASSRDPPLLPEEEETVKEVLSETPRPKSTENGDVEEVEVRSRRDERSPPKYRRKRSASVEIANVGCRSGRLSPLPGRTIGRTHSARIRRDPGDRSSMRYEPPPAAKAKAKGRVSPRRIPAAPAGKREGDGVAGDGGRKESLENPLVSLECFIFL